MRRPVASTWLVGFVAIAAVGTAYLLWVYLPLEEAVVHTRLQGDEMSKRGEMLQVAAAHMPELVEAERRVADRMADLARILPNEARAGELSSRLGELAKAAGVTVDHLQTEAIERGATSSRFYDVSPLRVEMHGPLPAIVDFGARLGREPRLIRVTRWSVGSAPGSDYRAVVLLEGYAFAIPVGRKSDYIGG